MRKPGGSVMSPSSAAEVGRNPANRPGMQPTTIRSASDSPPASATRDTLMASLSPAGHRPHDEQRLGAGRHRIRQRGIRQLVGQILRAREEPHERPALLGGLIADRPAQRGKRSLERVEDRALRDLAGDLELHLAVDPRQRSQMGREHHPDHGSVWTSTDTTDGRSRTIGAQLSPELGETYTCPPEVPKYTPHGSRVSTAIASRSTLTQEWLCGSPL